MREISVHVHENVVARSETALEAGPIGVSQALLALASKHGDSAELVGDLLGQIGSPIRAVVVDDEYVGGWQGFAHPRK